MDQLPRLGKRELFYLLLFTCKYVVSVRRGFLFLWVLGMGYVILLWQFLGLPHNYYKEVFFLSWTKLLFLVLRQFRKRGSYYKYLVFAIRV